MTVDDVRRTRERPCLLDVIPDPNRHEPTLERTPNTRVGKPLRVLAIGINFGPEHTGIAPYTTGLCKYLADRGASVTMLTGVPHYPGWTVEPQDRLRLRRTEQRDGLQIRRLRHYVPRTQSAVRRALYELTFALQVATQRFHERPDVVLAVVPSLLSAVVARRVAARVGVPLVVWVQDLMGQAAAQSGIDGGTRVAGVVAAVERRVLRSADQVLVLSSHFADHVAAIGVDPRRVTVHPNWTHVPPPSGTHRDRVRARLGWHRDETIVLHTGNMGLKQDLGNVIAAARLVDEGGDAGVRFVLMGDGSQRKALEKAAEGVTSVQFLPPAPREQYTDVLAAADVLLVNERASSVDMCLPSKLTSYFRAGRPVIAASPARGGTAAEVAGSGAGVVVPPGKPDVLLHAVAKLSDSSELATLMGKLGLGYAEDQLDADRALGRLHQVLSTVATRAPGAG